MHKRYTVKSRPDTTRTLEIIREIGTGYMVRLRTEGAWNSDENTEFLSKHLFDTCLRTGYLTPVSVTVSHASNEGNGHEATVSVPA